MALIEYPHIIWKCQRCGKCCKDQEKRKRQILLTDYNIVRIKGTFVDVEFYRRINGSEPYRYQMVKKNGSCIFLSKNRCTVYNRRPLICRFYPFKMVEDEGYIFETDQDCPGVGFGTEIDKKFLTKLVEEAKRAL